MQNRKTLFPTWACLSGGDEIDCSNIEGIFNDTIFKLGIGAIEILRFSNSIQLTCSTELVKIPLSSLGLSHCVTLDEVQGAAYDRGLKKCQIGAAIELCVQCPELFHERLWVTLPVTIQGHAVDSEQLLSLCRVGEFNILGAGMRGKRSHWNSSDQFVFEKNS